MATVTFDQATRMYRDGDRPAVERLDRSERVSSRSAMSCGCDGYALYQTLRGHRYQEERP